MKPISLFLLLSLFLSACTTLTPELQSAEEFVAAPESQIPWPTKNWLESTPEEQGLDPDLVQDLLAAVEDQDLPVHSLLVIRHGAIVLEHYFPGYTEYTPHILYSVTKSFISTLIGIAVDKGGIGSLDDPVLKYFPGSTFENADPRKEAITLRNLLTMTSGLDWDEAMPGYRGVSTSGYKYVLDLPMAADPGSEFLYCSGCSHILSAVIEQTTGQSTVDFAEENLFKPLGIKKPSWEMDPEGTAMGGWGIYLTPRDMAKLGYLFLHQGQWDGEQIVSSGWVSEAISPQVSVDPGVSYGYQWWVFPDQAAYAAQGMEGQKIFVFPSHDLIVVATSGFSGDDPLLDLVMEYVIPALRD